jgi:transcriptional regulator with XRE-family HTH domain
MTSFKQFLEEELLDEEFAEHYDEVSAEMDFALALTLRRKKLGFTQQELADRIGMKQPMLARIEGGQMPNARTLQRLASGLKVGLMFTGDGVLLLPMAGSKTGTGQSVVHPVSEREWKLPDVRRIAERGPRATECDYTMLAREARPATAKQKETTNAGIATAA